MSDLLHELDAVVGCASRRWVPDGNVNVRAQVTAYSCATPVDNSHCNCKLTPATTAARIVLSQRQRRRCVRGRAATDNGLALHPAAPAAGRARIAVGETVVLPHPPLPLVDVSVVMERGCQQIDSLADG